MATTLLLSGGVLLTLSSDTRAEVTAEATFLVNSTSDSADINPGDGACDADDTASGNQCTLRAAIQESNTAIGADTIHFGIPGDGLHTIKLTSQLRALTDTSGPTTIDGYTQAGSSPNPAPLASNAKIMVQIKGGGDNLFGGLTIESPGNVVRGLAFYRLRGAIRLLRADAHDNYIVGNFLGTDATGRYRAAKRVCCGYASGVKLAYGASKNVIGGASVADRNVLSGNASHGVGLYDGGTNSNVIKGNLIGLTPSGKGNLANMAVGVDINYGASYNVVGGTLPGERNVISGNGREGVEVSHHGDIFPTANRVIGNFIGTGLSGESAPKYARNSPGKPLDAVHLVDGARESVVAHNVIGNASHSGVGIDGSNRPYTTGNKVYANRIGISRGGAAIPNGAAGIRIYARAKGSRIGPNNVIANNPIGVQVADTYTTLNTITRNSIYNNATLGIDLVDDGVAQKNLDKTDSGPNSLQNTPAVGSAVTSGNTTTIKGTLNSSPKNTYLIQFFSNPKGTGQGKKLIGQKKVTTGSGGKVSFIFRPTKVVRAGRTITATATDVGGNTSEFSAPKTVVQRRV
jgi:hypothetical protein